MHKANHYITIAFKCVVSLLLLFAIYMVFKERSFDWHTFVFLLDELDPFLIFLVMILSLSSWAVESFKWQYVCRGYWLLRFRESVLLNLLAQSASFFTPLRSGEFSVKCIYAPKHTRKKTLLSVAEANTAQMGITLFLGLLGFIYNQDLVLGKLKTWEGMTSVSTTLMLVIAGAGLAALLIWQKQRVALFLRAISDPKLLLLCFFRYLLFSHVWILLLLSLNEGISYLNATMMVWLFYLLVSILPIFQFLDVVVKMGIGALLFSALGLTLPEISAVTALAWLTNTLLPSLLGAVSVPFVKRQIS